MIRRLLVCVSAAAAVVWTSSPAFAVSGPVLAPAVPDASRMIEGKRTMAPVPHVIHCRANRAECRGSGVRAPVRLTAALWRQLRAVNARVNGAIRPVADAAAHGRADVWTVAARTGDCEDYAIAKRHELIRLGWSPSNVLLAVVLDTEGGGHAVAVVRTDRGDLVLDNLTGRIVSWDKTGYTWIKRQSTSDPRVWVKVRPGAAGGGAAAVATAPARALPVSYPGGPRDPVR